MLCQPAFPLVSALGSTSSAADRSALFAGFAATMTESDFSCPCIILVTLRRDLHEHPELAFEEHRTSGLVAQLLAGWVWKVRRGIGTTGVVGSLSVGHGKRTIALRADFDALPIQENAGSAWISRYPGKMHACGHDGHTAMR